MQKKIFFASNWLLHSWHKLAHPEIKFIMKVNLTCVLIVMLSCGIVSSKTMGQNIHRVKIEMGFGKIELSEALSQLEKASKINVFYRTDLVENKMVSEMSSKIRTVAETLDILLKDSGLSYKVTGNKIILHKENEDGLSVNLNTQQTVRGGIVKDDNGRPVGGVSVSIKQGVSLDKSSRVLASTSTDKNGYWSLVISNDSITVVFSLMGYQTQEIKVGDRKRFETILQPATQEIEGVVVNGIFTRRAATATGAQTTVTREQLLNSGTTNVVQSLRNIDPSFMIMENRLAGSDPNTLPDITVRGQSGLPDLNGDYATNPNLPLFILDGFETNLQRIMDLDIYRINSVTILKDAASKAIYGAKAANGVVVVETVRPQPGELRLSYNTNIGYEIADLSSYKLTNARQKLEAEVLAGIYESTNLTLQYQMMEQYNAFLTNIERGVETDWMAKPLRNGVRQNHSLGFSGGDSNFTYNATVTYNSTEGVMKGSSNKTLNGNVNLIYGYKKFNIRNDLTVGNRKGSNSPWGAFSQYVSMNPYLAYTDENGNVLQTALLRARRDVDPGNASLAGFTSNVLNPAYNATLNTFDNSNSTTITNNINLDWTLMPGLWVNGRFGFFRQLDQYDTYLPAEHNSFFNTIRERRGSYEKRDGAGNNYDGQLNVSFSKILGVHAITLNTGVNVNQNSGYQTGFIAEGFPNDKLAFPSLGLQYKLNSRPIGSEHLSRDMGIFTSANYSFDERYNVDLTYRASQSSQYGANNRWAHLWSAGVSWNLHNQGFIKELNFVDQMRLRATTGFTGSQGFNTFLGIGSYTYDLDLIYSGNNGAYLLGMANPDLKWQRRQDHNVGFDLALFRKLSARADYAIGYTDGLLTDITLPTSTGFGSYKANLGRVRNQTLELNLTYNAYRNAAERSSLSFFVAFAQNRNKLLQISNSLAAYNQSQNALSNQSETTAGMSAEAREAALAASRANISKPKILFVEGQSMNAIYAVRSLGIDPATGRERYLKADGVTTTYDWDANDQVVVGNSLPLWNGNFGINLAYKGIRLNTIFRFELGGQLYNETLVNRVENADIFSNVDARVLTDRWQKPGDVARFKSIQDRTVTRVSSRFVEDNNNVTLGFLQVGYDLDRLASIRALGFSQLRAFITSSELFQISSMRIERGTSYPFARTVQFTLNANF